MCTLSFVPKADGYLLAMNRDEQRTRIKALPPTLHGDRGLPALYPSEPGGGTWIGINGKGISIALINWYSRPQLQGIPAFSRGSIIPGLLSLHTPDEMDRSLFSLPLARLNPFRLFIMGRESDHVREYRSERSGVIREDHAWKSSHWFSSGHDEVSANEKRGKVCRKASEDTDSRTLAWLKRLHASHDPEAGADSICMHRDDAVTVSMTLLEVSKNIASMHYHDGAPCDARGTLAHTTRMTLNF